VDVFRALLDRATELDEAGGAHANSSAGGVDRDAAPPTFTIRNIEFRNARTRVAHCVVNNMDVDISVNQIFALASNIFLEECDRMIARNHLLKRSTILVKVMK
jgi:hypothetical protein